MFSLVPKSTHTRTQASINPPDLINHFLSTISFKSMKLYGRNIVRNGTLDFIERKRRQRTVVVLAFRLYSANHLLNQVLDPIKKDIVMNDESVSDCREIRHRRTTSAF